MAKIYTLEAKANIPVRSKRSTAKNSVVKGRFIAQGEEVSIVDQSELRGVKYGELEDGNFVIIERGGVANFK